MSIGRKGLASALRGESRGLHWERRVSDVTEPRWLRVIALWPALAIASFGAVGLWFADLGWYRLRVVLPLGAVVFATLCACTRPLLRRNDAAPPAGSNRWSLAAVGFSVAYAVWNCFDTSQHVQINRDGALYLNTGKWVASRGTLSVHPIADAFSASDHLTYTSNGIALVGRHLEFSLSHMLPALLAEAQGIGGDHLMFLAAPIMSGLALIAFYALALRLTRHPPAALGATACLAFLMPQVSFSRDTTSEIPTQVLLFTAVWLLCDPKTWRAPRAALCAGLLLGAVQAMHVDGLAYMLGLPLAAAAVAIDVRARHGRGVRAGIAWLSIGLVPGLALSAVDLTLRDRRYLSSVHGQLAGLAAALALSIVIGAALFIGLRRRSDGVTPATSSRRRWGTAATLATVAAGFGAWFLRPVLQHTHGASNGTVAFVQMLEHVHVDSTRTYGELSVRWISWYVGPLTLALGILAAAVLAGALVKGTARLPTRIAAFMLAPPALLYLVKPSVTPDHIWAMRRFLPAVLPGFVLLAFGALSAIVRASGPGSARTRRSWAVVLGICAIGYPVWTIAGVSRMTEQRGQYAAVRAVCELLGPQSAAIVLRDQDSFLYRNDPQTLRSFCHIPVAIMDGTPDGSELREIAKAWSSDGRRLFVVSQAPETIRRALPGLAVRTTAEATNRHLLNSRLLWRPDRYTSESLRFAVALVPSA
jgi:hypothetical protein